MAASIYKIRNALCKSRNCSTLSHSVSVQMAAKLMHAVQYDSYGGGTSGLKVRYLSFFLSFWLFNPKFLIFLISSQCD